MRIIIFVIIAITAGCGQMDYQVGTRTVCGEYQGPCEDVDAGTDTDIDAGDSE